MNAETPRPPARGSGLKGRWSDLAPRFYSAFILGLVGGLAIWVGGIWFTLFVVLSVGVIVWELSQICDASYPVILGALAAVCLLVLALVPPGYGLPLVMVPVFASFGQIGRERLAHALFTVAVMLAGFGLIGLRSDFAVIWVIWLVAVVVITDVAGYFAGRLIGGPRFWPRVSPKKTWAGTAAGWICAGLFGACLFAFAGAGPRIIGISVALSMASQMGDIAESALKRQVGVKDSSGLLPGHGGFFDRFDGILGAAVFLLLVEEAIGFPPSGE